MAALGDPVQLLKQNFNCFKPESFWHFVMKKEGHDLLQYLEADQSFPRSGQVVRQFYESRSICSWTPLHVAAIQGNKIGISFLCSKGVSLGAKDDYGCTPLDYCTRYHPELLPLMRSSLNREADVSVIMQSFLKKWHVELSQKDVCYHEGSHDFGVEIQELLLSNSPIPSSSKADIKGDFFIKNLQKISLEQGFDVKVAPIQYMVRDYWIPIPNEGFALPACSENVQKAIERTESLSLSQQNRAMFCTTHEYFDGSIGAVNLHLTTQRSDFEPSLKGLCSLMFYLEGGDHYQVFLQGQRKVMIGDVFLYIILNQFRLDKRFDESSIADQAKQIAENLTQEQIKQVLSEMYSQGLLKEAKGCLKGFISFQGVSSILTQVLCSHILQGKDIPSGAYLKEAERRKFFTPLDLTEKQIHASRGIASRYLAQIQAVKTTIAKTFKVSVEDLIFIPQVDYHLDVFMRPGPKESFFVQDYQCVYELLQLIESKAAQLQLSSRDLQMLKRYTETAKTLERQLRPLLEATREKLTAAGFTVIPTPGIFYDATPISINSFKPMKARTYNVNFINAITGYSTKTGRYYYIAGGAETGGLLGSILMDVYREFLKSYEEDMDVYFVGENPDRPGDFWESRSWLNRIGKQSGIHCFSTELKTSSHSTQA